MDKNNLVMVLGGAVLSLKLVPMVIDSLTKIALSKDETKREEIRRDSRLMAIKLQGSTKTKEVPKPLEVPTLNSVEDLHALLPETKDLDLPNFEDLDPVQHPEEKKSSSKPASFLERMKGKLAS